MSRFKAASIHLCISALLVGSVFGIVFWSWYPAPSFEVVGASSIIKLLVGVDLVLGPLLTLIVYKQGKPGLKFDLSVIAAVQLAALVFGAHRLYAEKPDYLIFAVDRIEFVSGQHVDASQIRFDELRKREAGELTMAVAEPPQDPDEYQAYLDSVIVGGMPDLESRPEFWLPWAQGGEQIREAIKSLDQLQPNSKDEERRLQKAIERHGDAHPNLGILPIGGIQEDIGMLVDRDTLELLGTLRVNPWVAGES